MTNEQPRDVAAEQAVLGAMFVDPEAVAEVQAILPDEAMFWRTSHQRIYRAAIEVSQQGADVDWVNVKAQIAKNGHVGDCGGEEVLHAYLIDITNSVPSGYGAKRYAEIVRGFWQRRRAIVMAYELIDRAHDQTSDIQAEMTRAARELVDLSTDLASADPKRIEHFIREALEASKVGGIRGLMSPWTSLNDITTGWKPGQLIVTAARTSVGKSAFAGAVAAHHADSGVLVFSLEMTGREIAARMICTKAGVDSRLFEQGKLNNADRAEANTAAESLKGNLWIDDSAGMDIARLRSKASRWVAKHGVSMVIVDYLGLVDEKIKGANRAQIVGSISRGLKLLAMEARVPVVALHQLNRDTAKEKREPQLHDLRDSGNIEEDADQVILLHRKERKEQEGIDIIKVKVAKNRGGPVASTELAFRRKFTRFEEVERYEQPEDGRYEQAYGRDEDR